MSKKKRPNFPELEAMLEDMQELLTDEYGNPLPPDHPHVKKLHRLAEHIGTASDENKGRNSPAGHA